MKTIPILLLLSLLGSCKISDVKLAHLCSERFPCKVSTTLDSMRPDSVKRGRVESLPPIIYTLECPQSDKPVLVNVSVSGGEKRVDTVYQTRYSHTTIHDSALVFVYQDSFKKEQVNRAAYQAKVAHQSKMIGRLWLWLIGLFLLVLMLLRKPSLKILSFFRGVLRD